MVSLDTKISPFFPLPPTPPPSPPPTTHTHRHIHTRPQAACLMQHFRSPDRKWAGGSASHHLKATSCFPIALCQPGVVPRGSTPKASQGSIPAAQRGQDGGRDCQTDQEAEPGPSGAGRGPWHRGLNLATDGDSRRAYGVKGPVVDLHPGPVRSWGELGFRAGSLTELGNPPFFPLSFSEALAGREGLQRG